MPKYTEEQIKQYMNYVGGQSGVKYTPEQLAQYEKYIRTNYGDTPTKELPLGHPDNPAKADIFSSDINRTKAGFGDLEGIAPMIQQKGFTDVKKNASGELIAKGPDGKYYKDANEFFGGHPLNWAESHLGGAYPLAGMALGAAGAGALATPGTLGVGTIPASIAGAGVGAGVGEGARIGIGKYLGVHKGGAYDVNKDILGEGAMGALSEFGGKKIGMIPLPGKLASVDNATKMGLEKLVGMGQKGVTKISQALTGVDADAYLRQLLRPNQVKNALAPGNSLAVTRAAQDELSARAGQEGKAISQARQAFADKYGGEQIPTTPMQDTLEQAMARNAPNSSGRSGMTPDEFLELNDLKAKDLSTHAPDMYGNSTSQPVKSAGELQRTADWLQQQVSPNQYKGSAPTRSDKSQGTYQRLLGQLKDAFHEKSPELKSADAQFSDYADKAKILGPVEGPAGESFSSSLFGANKGARQEAAKDLIPGAYEGMADIGAKKATQTDSRLSKFGPSAPAILRSGTALGSGMAGFAASGNLEGGLLGLGLGTGVAVGTSPAVHAQAYYLAGKYGMPVVKALVDNPQLAPVLLDGADYGKLKSYWSDVTPGGNDETK